MKIISEGGMPGRVPSVRFEYDLCIIKELPVDMKIIDVWFAIPA